MILELVGGLLSQIFGGVTDHFKHKRKLKEAEVENRARLLKDEQSNNHEWEMANLMDKDKFLRWISFAMFTFPFLWIYFDAQAAAEYFQILDRHLPDWYKQTYMGMTGGIWGISALKNAVPGLVSGVMNSVRNN